MPLAADLLFLMIDEPSLTERERGLLREIAHRVQLGTHHNWDPKQKDEVLQLFRKLAACFGVSLTL